MGVTHFKGISVHSSGLYWGDKNAEVPLGIGPRRVDGGRFGYSGTAYNSMSTQLSSIVSVCATIDFVTDGGTVPLWSSGNPIIVDTAFSGHCVDFFKFAATSGWTTLNYGTLTSTGTSTAINWIALGT